jgi:ribosomal protein S18 acetylase RimI-like enzyme
LNGLKGSMLDGSARLFAGTEIAARIESVERSLIQAGGEAAAGREPAGRVVALPIGSGLAVWAGPDSPLNKIAGLGFAGTFEDRELEAVERAFGERGAPVQFEISTLADPGVWERLSRRGYVLRGFENVLALSLVPGRAVRLAEGVEVCELSASDFDGWLSVVVEGFANPDLQGVASPEEFPRAALERAMRDLTAAAGFVCSMALVDGVAAGGASVRRSSGVAQLCGAATRPAFRCRGVQSSLLSARLSSAAATGCDLAVVTTQPGSKSQQNVQKLGFELVYARAVLVRPA